MKSHDVDVVFQPNIAGTFHLVFLFELDFGSKAHEVVLTIVDRDVEALRSKSDWVERDLDFFERSIVPAFPPERKTRTHRNIPLETSPKEPLPVYDVPKKIQADVDETGRARAFNPWKVREALKTRLHNLLYVEEAEQRKQMRRYDLYDQSFENVKSFVRGPVTLFADPLEPLIRIRVPGLAEKRPSILVGSTTCQKKNSQKKLGFLRGFVFFCLVFFCGSFRRPSFCLDSWFF